MFSNDWNYYFFQIVFVDYFNLICYIQNRLTQKMNLSQEGFYNADGRTSSENSADKLGHQSGKHVEDFA